MDSRLTLLIQNALETVKKVRIFAEDENLLNEQEYIDFEVILSKISTMDPNTKIENGDY